MNHNNTMLALLGATLMACGGRPAARAPLYSPAPEAMVEATPSAPATDTAASAPITAALVATEEVAAPPEVHAVETIGEAPVTYHLRRGETLDHFARWAELPVEVVAEHSGLGLSEALAVGVVIRVPADQERRSRIELRRDAHHERRAEGYLASRGGSVSTEFHVVRTGDTAWSIAKENGNLPVWLVETFNPSLDLEALRPGQAVMLPVTGDMIDAVSMLEDEPLSAQP